MNLGHLAGSINGGTPKSSILDHFSGIFPCGNPQFPTSSTRHVLHLSGCRQDPILHHLLAPSHITLRHVAVAKDLSIEDVNWMNQGVWDDTNTQIPKIRWVNHIHSVIWMLESYLYMLFWCFLNVIWMLIECFSNLSWMLFECYGDVFCMLIDCYLDVIWILSKC